MDTVEGHPFHVIEAALFSVYEDHGDDFLDVPPVGSKVFGRGLLAAAVRHYVVEEDIAELLGLKGARDPLAFTPSVFLEFRAHDRMAGAICGDPLVVVDHGDGRCPPMCDVRDADEARPAIGIRIVSLEIISHDCCGVDQDLPARQTEEPGVLRRVLSAFNIDVGLHP